MMRVSNEPLTIELNPNHYTMTTINYTFNNIAVCIFHRYSDGCGSGRSSPRERWTDYRWRRDGNYITILQYIVRSYGYDYFFTNSLSNNFFVAYF